MAEPGFQDLLAPTWPERARAADAYLFAAAPTLQELRALQPSPEVFLPAFLSFWAEVAALQIADAKKRLLGKEVQTGGGWISPHERAFPMTPPLGEVGFTAWFGLHLWKHFAALGPYVGALEGQLLACLEHPNPIVSEAACVAFGAAETLGDAAFARLLADGDARHPDPLSDARSTALAKHARGERVAALLHGLEADADERRAQARLAVVEGLEGDAARAARQHLLELRRSPWSDHVLGTLLHVLANLAARLGTDAAEAAWAAECAARRDPAVRSAAAHYLAQHAAAGHGEQLFRLAADPGAGVRQCVCIGLESASDAPIALVRAAAAHALGNYDAGDGDPHESAVRLLLARREYALAALPELLAWWNTASARLDRAEVWNALDLFDLLGDDGAQLVPGLRRSLAALERGEDRPIELPSLDQPGAIPLFRESLEQALRQAIDSPEEASRIPALHAAALEVLKSEAPKIQAQIDAHQERWDAAQRAVYPERCAEEAAAEDEEPSAPPPHGADDETGDELLDRLRATLRRVGAR